MPRTRRTPKKRPQSESLPDWGPAFLERLRSSGNVRFACQAASIGRRTAYDRREADETFKAAWDEAIEDACDALEAAAWQRATGGDSPSDTLLIFLLKAHRPYKYRENINLNHTGQPIIQVVSGFDEDRALGRKLDNDANTANPTSA